MRGRHAIVIGGGIVGLASARELRRRGDDVTILEREASGEAGASAGNAGIVVPSGFVPLAAPGVVAKALRWMADPTSPFHIRPRASLDLLAWGWRFMRSANAAHVQRAAPTLVALNLASRRMMDELAAEIGPFGLTPRGLLNLCLTEEALAGEAALAETARELGLAAEVLDAAGVAALEPELPIRAVGAMRIPEDAHLDPAALMRALRGDLARAGARLRAGADVRALAARGNGVEVTTSDGERVSGDVAVLAGGSWSAPLARALGVRLLLQPGKGYALTLPGRSGARLRSAAILVEAKAAATQVGDRLWVGGTMEIAGFDPRVNPARVEGIKRAALRYFPTLAREELDAARPWMGFRPVSPDGLPYLGRAPRAPQVVIAAGHAMMGLSLGPITGRLVAELAAGERPSLDVALLDPARHT